MSISARDLPFPIIIEVPGSREEFLADIKSHIKRLEKDSYIPNFLKVNDIRKSPHGGLGYIHGFVGDPKP